MHEDDKDVPPSDVADLTFEGMGLLQTFFCIDVEGESVMPEKLLVSCVRFALLPVQLVDLMQCAIFLPNSA